MGLTGPTSSPWQRHAEKWRDCHLCDLCSQRDRIVLAKGDVPCDLLIIGEAPGESENVTGLPFTGPAGHLLGKIVASATDGIFIQDAREATVVHKDRAPYDVYVGRPSKWGNPFVVGRDGTRAEVIEKYERWFDSSGLDVSELSGKVLGCHCKPLPCHGDYLAALANATGGALRPIRVAWTNLVACFPLHAKREGSNEPSKRQILACQPRLAEFIELCRPRVIVRAGKLAEDWVSYPEGTCDKCVDVVHPAHILRMPVVQQDMATRRCVVQIANAIEEVFSK